jgi:hypothetical protein
MRLQRDLDRTNLCESLGRELTGQQYRDSVHRPWSVVLVVGALTFALAIVLPWLIQTLSK